jgi:uncharacterized membrane protein YbhN (UPF0104 family)
LRLLLGITLLGGLFWLADPARTVAALRSVSWQWLFPIAGAIFVSTILGAVNLYLFIGRDGRIRWRDFLPVYWAGWAMGLVVPGQIGDVGSIAALLRRYDFDWHQTLGSAGLDKLISFAVMALLGTTGAAIVLGSRNGAPIALGAIACAAAGGYLAIRRRARRCATGQGLFAVTGRSIVELETTARRHPWRVVANLVLTLAKIAALGFAYWCTFSGLGSRQYDYGLLTLLMAASALVAYIPVSLNGIGTVEAAGIWLFGKIGIAAHTVLAAYLLLRALVLILAWVPVLTYGIRHGLPSRGVRS